MTQPTTTTPPVIEWAVSDALVPYADAMARMTQRANDIADGKARELIWLLEHPPLYTAGTSAKRGDLIDPDLLPVFDVGRGGQYTYHGPGQRIAYVMLNIRQRGGDVRALVSGLERWIIAALDRFNVKGETRDGRVGIWVRHPGKSDQHDFKIAAIGLRVARGVTTHGISLNVEPNLDHYRGIVACGITDHGVTSLADLGLPVTMTDADVALRLSFERTIGPVRIVPAHGIGLSPSVSALGELAVG